MLWPAMAEEANDATAAVELPEGIDAERLEAWFRGNAAGVEPPLAYRRISGGRSNLTFEVSDRAGRRWALRRPPLGKRLGSAHDMGREHRVISALAPTEVPVAPVVGLCEDESVNGAPFYVMGFVDGHVIRDRALAERALTPAARAHASESIVDTLAAIHAVDLDAVGLSDLGRHEGYIERQLRRWYSQWNQQKTRELPAVDEVHERLLDAVQTQGPATIVHGDYRLDNTIVSTAGDVVAVLDWEICTLGDPLADVGLLHVYWTGPHDEATAWDSQSTRPEGFAGRDEMLARYAATSGRE